MQADLAMTGSTTSETDAFEFVPPRELEPLFTPLPALNAAPPLTVQDARSPRLVSRAEQQKYITAMDVRINAVFLPLSEFIGSATTQLAKLEKARAEFGKEGRAVNPRYGKRFIGKVEKTLLEFEAAFNDLWHAELHDYFSSLFRSSYLDYTRKDMRLVFDRVLKQITGMQTIIQRATQLIAKLQGHMGEQSSAKHKAFMKDASLLLDLISRHAPVNDARDDSEIRQATRMVLGSHQTLAPLPKIQTAYPLLFVMPELPAEAFPMISDQCGAFVLAALKPHLNALQGMHSRARDAAFWASFKGGKVANSYSITEFQLSFSFLMHRVQQFEMLFDLCFGQSYQYAIFNDLKSLAAEMHDQSAEPDSVFPAEHVLRDAKKLSKIMGQLREICTALAEDLPLEPDMPETFEEQASASPTDDGVGSPGAEGVSVPSSAFVQTPPVAAPLLLSRTRAAAATGVAHDGADADPVTTPRRS